MFSLIPFLTFTLSIGPPYYFLLIFLSCNPLFCPLPFSPIQSWTNSLHLYMKSTGTHHCLTSLNTFSKVCDKFLFRSKSHSVNTFFHIEKSTSKICQKKKKLSSDLSSSNKTGNSRRPGIYYLAHHCIFSISNTICYVCLMNDCCIQ